MAKKPRKWRRLIEARKMKGYTQASMADICGVATSTYVRWENLQFEPSLSQIKTISYILSVPVDWLIGNIGFDRGTDVDYWTYVHQATSLLGSALIDPESFLNKQNLLTDDVAIAWVSDKLNLPVDYFDPEDLSSVLPSTCDNKPNEEQVEADSYFKVYPLTDEAWKKLKEKQKNHRKTSSDEE